VDQPAASPQVSGDWSVDGIMADITQNKLAVIKLSRIQLAELSSHLQTVKRSRNGPELPGKSDDLGGNSPR
jgi:hypothetical protein